jgi:hypothetical protein
VRESVEVEVDIGVREEEEGQVDVVPDEAEEDVERPFLNVDAEEGRREDEEEDAQEKAKHGN